MSNVNIESDNDLLAFLIKQSNSDKKNWFGFQEQRIAGIDLAYKIAANHADIISPEQAVDYVIKLNDEIYKKILKVQ